SGITPYGYFLINGKPMLRQGDTRDCIWTFLGHKGAVWGATLNNDATKAAADFTAKVWDAHIVKSDSNHLLTGGNDKMLCIFDKSKPDAEPQEIAGHRGAIKEALWCNNDKQMLSAVVKSLSFEASVGSMEYMPEGEILVVTYGKTIAFYNALTLDLIKTVHALASIHSASLHPDKDFVSYKGHFGPVHCVRFSPDGELYASGSEDGTLRLWQTAVGKTYGLWKCMLLGEGGRQSIRPCGPFQLDTTDVSYPATPEIKA
uniref:Serine-threonine kinase receptor-associated protein n=1 Tax=Hucho hucho TaxID=62062 RepID=A0A4W5M0C4_9TELE